MVTRTKTPESLRAEADRIERRERFECGTCKVKQPRLYTFSHMVMFGIMLMFFVGVGLGVYVTVILGETLSVTLDYIMKLAKPVALGYFVKAFGENIAKIVLSAIFGTGVSDSRNEGSIGSG